MKPTVNAALKVLSALPLAVLPLPSFAFPAGDLMDHLSAKERLLYVTGLVDMTIYYTSVSGDEKKSNCIIEWFHGDDGDKAMAYLEKHFAHYTDKQAQPLVTILINRKCPDSATDDDAE